MRAAEPSLVVRVPGEVAGLLGGVVVQAFVVVDAVLGGLRVDPPRVWPDGQAGLTTAAWSAADWASRGSVVTSSGTSRASSRA